MISATDLRKGVTFELDGDLYRVLEYQHSYVGRGSANIRVRLRNLHTGRTLERTFGTSDRFQDVRLELRQIQYLYRDGDLYYFMDTETYEQPALSAEALQDELDYLKEGMQLSLSMYEGQPVEVELPVTVDLEVTQTERGVKGDTATGATKRAILETGLAVQVPLFVDEGDIVRVDTRTGEYLTRV
ncbi:MAG TPA: elongation factor P [Anaerolineae bacterium]|jgi:elongation factor P|nr:elongation factor P [Anaerolineae bacterium]